MPTETFQKVGEQIAASHSDVWTKETFDRLSRMIDYGIKRQDWYEDQRNKILSLAVGLLGLSSFLVAGLLNSEATTMYWFRIFGGFTLLSIVSTALLIILEYGVGASERYTHRSLADIRSWYFAYVINEPVVVASKFDANNQEKNSETLLSAWKNFLAGWIEYQKSDRTRAIEDLQQVFILYLFQAMRRKSLRKMIEIAGRGGKVIGIFLLPTIICAGFRI